MLTKSAANGESAVRAVPSSLGLADSLSVLLDGETGAVLVEDSAKGGVTGLLSERMYIGALNHGSFAPQGISAGDICTRKLVPVASDTLLTSMLSAMVSAGQRHAVVVSPDFAQKLLAGSVDSAAPWPRSAIQTVVSMRQAVTALAEGVWRYQREALKVPEEELKQGKPLEEALAKAAGSAAAAAAAASDAAATSPPPWSSTCASMLDFMKASGRRRILNTRLEDDITAADAANIFAEHSVNCLAVLADDGKLAGIFTSRDFLTRVVLPGQNAGSVHVRDVMTRDPYCADTEHSILRCARTMGKKSVRHLPIVDPESQRPMGIVSMMDVAKSFIYV